MIDPLSALIHRSAGTHGPVALMYHSVAPGGGVPAWPWAVSMRRFCAQLDFLAEAGWRTATLSELLAAPERFPGRTVAITFDDGYLDNDRACEALQQRGMCATWFVVSGSIGREPDWPADGRPPGRMLDASELRRLQAAGMEIGSHGRSHVSLARADAATLDAELSDSKAALEDLLGMAVPGLAYPYGEWDPRCEQAAARAGYRYACTTQPGWALRDANPYRLRRLTVFNSDGTASLARKLGFGGNDASWRAAMDYGRRRLFR